MVRLAAAFLLIATVASAHEEADVRMLIDVPQFVPIAQTFRYRVIADDVSNDSGAGVIVTIALPAQVQLARIAPNALWQCSASNATITCKADEIEPGPNPIDLDIIAPAHPSALHATASVESTESVDLNPANDIATADIYAFDPAVCMAAAPQLIAPADASLAPPLVPLSWTAVPGAQSYTIYTAVEGAAASPVLDVTSNEAMIVADPGTSEWWVAANFANCPAVTSAHRRFTAASTLPRAVRTYATGFRSPFGLALAPNGDLYVSDEADDVIRKISSGCVTTVAGAQGVAGNTDGQFALFQNPRGLAVTPFDGFVFAADTLNNEVRILYTGGPFVPAFNISAGGGFKAPSGIAATERGTVYVADTDNHAIRKLTPVPDFVGVYNVSTVASGFHAPLGVAVDANDNVYVADTADGSIRKLDGSVIARGFDHPTGITLDTLGNFFVTDRTSVYRIAPSGLVTKIASGFVSAAGIVVDPSDRIFVADSGAHAVYVVDRPLTRRRPVR